MTQYSLNKQFEGQVQKTQSSQQKHSDKQEMKQHNIDKSAKSPNFLKDLSKALYDYVDQDKKLSVQHFLDCNQQGRFLYEKFRF